MVFETLWYTAGLLLDEKFVDGKHGFKIWLPARTAVCLEKVKKPRKAKDVVVVEEPVVEEKPKAKRTRKAKAEK